MKKKDYDMDEKTAKKVVDLIFQTPSKGIVIEFQGGEPVLNFDIIKFITRYAKEKNKEAKKKLSFSLVSNLTQMSDEKLDFIIKEKIGLCTSLDGPRELHNKNRQGYDEVVRWIRKIKKRFKEEKIKHTKINALVTITKDSLQFPKQIIDEYLDLGIEGIHLRSLNNLGNAQLKLDRLSYSSDEFLDFWKKSMDYIIDINKKGKKFMERKTLIILKKLFDRSDPNYMDLRSPCGAAIGQIVYNYNGRIYTCDEGRMVEEDLFCLGTVDDDYKDLTTGPVACSMIAASINDIQFCDKCAYKTFCGIDQYL